MKLLITGACLFTKSQIEAIAGLGNDVVFLKDEKDILPCNPNSIEGIICNGLFLYHDIKEFTSLKFVQLTSSGLDRIPIKYCEEHGILLKNAKGVYSIPMAEFAVSGILDILKKKDVFYSNQRNHIWKKERDLLELYDKSVLIVGCGSVGEECAKRLSSFGCNVYGVDLLPTDKDSFITIDGIDSLDSSLSKADIVVLTLPLTEQTMRLFDSKRFNQMKKESIFVNVSRGKIVDEQALLEALNTKLLGAVVDVFADEPLNENSPLWSANNIIITPHNSFVGQFNSERLFKLVIKNLQCII